MTHIWRHAGLTAAFLLVFASSASADNVVADDQIVQGSLCAGLDCANGEVFGQSVIAKLKAGDTGLLFEDTSLAPVAATDWMLQANDTSAEFNAFYLKDVTAGTTPFSVFAAAPTNSLRVANTGNVGIGTGNPLLRLSLRNSDTPGIRLEQDDSVGYPPQTWDIAGNEANFFVRDLTGGSRLPFRIRPGAATSSIDIAANSNVGFGTQTPAFPLDAVKTGVTGPMQRLSNNGPSSLRFENTATTPSKKWDVGSGATNFTVGPADAAPALTVTPGGDATTGGVVQQSTATENAAPVDAANVLAKLRTLPITQSELTSDPGNALHLSPAGADFRAAFGLGSSEAAIAPADLASVSLVGLQALAARVDDLDTSRVGSLGTRIDTVEKAIAVTSGESTRIDTVEQAIAATSGQSKQITQLLTFATAANKRVTKLEKSNKALAKRLTALEKKVTQLSRK